MSNAFAPTGFQFIRNYYSGAPTYQSTWNAISATNSSNIGKGDAVLLLSTGLVDLAIASTSPIFGICDGFKWYDTVQQKTIWSAGWNAPGNVLANSAFCSVITDPQAVFSVQSSAASAPAAITQSNIGQNAKLVAGTPQSATGISTQYLDQATIATTSTFPFRIIGFGAGVLNDPTSANSYVEVIANPGTWMATTGTGI